MINPHSKSATKDHGNHYSPPHIDKRSYTTEDCSSIPEISPRRHHKRRHVEEVLQGELRNINPPILMVITRKV